MVHTVSRKRWLLNPPRQRCPKPFCQCWIARTSRYWKQIKECTCGEENDVNDWQWEQPQSNTLSRAVVSMDGRQITFHPYNSSGTVVVRGNTPLQHNFHHYWEVKMLTDTHGTEISVGIGSHKVDVAHVNFQYASPLGQDRESYGMSYTGMVKHDAVADRESVGFCRGTIIGVRVDMWAGTLEFYLNRKPQGVAFYNLRRHKKLYPMVCSTAMQSRMRLTYASSLPASLLVHAARALTRAQRDSLPPGLRNKLRTQFWLMLPTDGLHFERPRTDVCQFGRDGASMEYWWDQE